MLLPGFLLCAWAYAFWALGAILLNGVIDVLYNQVWSVDAAPGLSAFAQADIARAWAMLLRLGYVFCLLPLLWGLLGQCFMPGQYHPALAICVLYDQLWALGLSMQAVYTTRAFAACADSFSFAQPTFLLSWGLFVPHHGLLFCSVCHKVA
jgi:hypothetical protein